MLVLSLPWWQIALAVLVVTVGSARLTRVLVHDDFPPAIWVRIQWDNLTNDGPWAKLVHCHWCASWWVILVGVGLFLLTPLAAWIAWVWWIFYASLSMAYAAAWIVERDED